MYTDDITSNYHDCPPHRSPTSPSSDIPLKSPHHTGSQNWIQPANPAKCVLKEVLQLGFTLLTLFLHHLRSLSTCHLGSQKAEG